MLRATNEEEEEIRDYLEWQARRDQEKVEFLQKVYTENVAGDQHDIWDVHTNRARWWVITNPTNLYSQEQFPNMDLALTFHLGLSLRIPRSHRPDVKTFPIEPFAEVYRYLSEGEDAVAQAQEVADFQAIGVRCREALLAFAHAAQTVMPWTEEGAPPQRSNFKAWVDHTVTVSLSGPEQAERRKLFKTLLLTAWDFANWLTHTKNSRWLDAEAATNAAGNALSMAIASVIQHIRGVPSACPACGSNRLYPQRLDDDPDDVWERPACMKCDWAGAPVKIEKVPTPPIGDRPKPEGECIIPTVPLRKLKQPK